MAERKDIWISWGMGFVPDSIKPVFERPTAFIVLPTPANRGYRQQVSGFGWPYPIRGIVSKYAPGVTPNRIAILGFSESCTGLRELLQSRDAGLIDTVVAVDGIHAQYDAMRMPMRAMMAAWIAYASLAAGASNPVSEGLVPGQRHLVITHSSIKPPYASTTETAEAILRGVFGDVWPSQCDFDHFGRTFVETPAYVAPSGSLSGVQYPETVYSSPPLDYSVCQAGLAILGYSNLDPTGIGDHKYQAQRLLPRVVEELVAPRWNAESPVVSEVSSAPELNPRGVTVPEDVWGTPIDQSIPWREYLTGDGGDGSGGGNAGFDTVAAGDEGQKPSLSVAGSAISLLIGGAVGFGVAHGIRALVERD